MLEEPVKRQARQREAGGPAPAPPLWLEAARKPVAFRLGSVPMKTKPYALAMPGTPVPGRLAQEDGYKAFKTSASSRVNAQLPEGMGQDRQECTIK